MVLVDTSFNTSTSTNWIDRLSLIFVSRLGITSSSSLSNSMFSALSFSISASSISPIVGSAVTIDIVLSFDTISTLTAFLTSITSSLTNFFPKAGSTLSLEPNLTPACFSTPLIVLLYVTNVCSFPSTFIVTVFLALATTHIDITLITKSGAVIANIFFALGPLEKLFLRYSLHFSIIFFNLLWQECLLNYIIESKFLSNSPSYRLINC